MAMQRLRAKKAFIIDMDGVLYHGTRLMPGVREFIGWLRDEGKKYLFVTNASERSPRQLQAKMQTLGISTGAADFYTSAQATAAFLAAHRPGGKAYVIGEPCLTEALAAVGYGVDDEKPDFVVVGETRHYSFAQIERAVNLVYAGARLIGTNPDLVDPGENGLVPSTGAMIAPIERGAGVKAFFVGKPNPFILRQGLALLGAGCRDTVVIGDRLDTDILAGIQANMETLLVLSGIATAGDIVRSAFQPTWVLNGVKDIPG